MERTTRTFVVRSAAPTTYFVEVDAGCCKVELFDTACRRFYRARLFDALARHSVELHAYALLADRVQLLVSAPSTWPLNRLLNEVHDTYLRYYNQRYRRTLRSKHSSSALCQLNGEVVVREVYRFIERQPLEAGESLRLGDSEWSSYAANAFGRGGVTAARSGWRLVRHSCLSDMVPNAAALALYREFVERPLEPLYARLLSSSLRLSASLDSDGLRSCGY